MRLLRLATSTPHILVLQGILLTAALKLGAPWMHCLPPYEPRSRFDAERLPRHIEQAVSGDVDRKPEALDMGSNSHKGAYCPWHRQTLALLSAALAMFLPWFARLPSRERSQQDVDALVAHVRQMAAGATSRPCSCADSPHLQTLAHALKALDTQLQTQQQIHSVMRHAVSHEMRAPLARMEFALELLREQHSALGGTIDELVADLRDLDALTTDSAEYYRFATMPQIQQEVFDLRQVLAALPMKPTEEAPHLTILPTPQPVWLCGNRPAITLAVRNLLANALRHAHGRVEVGLWYEHAHVHLLVDDDGPGIPAEHRQRVFEPYVRLAGGANGSGLGLAMVKIIVETHGGSICVNRSALGGASICLRLPFQHQ